MPASARNIRWRRITSGVAPHRRIADEAADEARLIMASGELALHHAADLTRVSATGRPRAANFASYRKPARLWVEVMCYAASIMVAALVIAVFLFAVVPRGGVVPVMH